MGKNIIRIFITMSCVIAMSSCGHHEGEDHEDAHEYTHEEGHHHEGKTVIDSIQASQYGLETEVMTPGTFAEVIRVSGEIEPAISDVYTVTALKSGTVRWNDGIGKGSEVKSGMSLGTISSDGLEGGDMSQAAVSNLESAKKEYERLRPLYEDGLVTASVFNEAERAYKEAQALTGKRGSGGSQSLTSGIAGTLSDLYVTSGEFVSAGTPVALITKNTRLTLKADVPARYAPSLPKVVTANIRIESSDEIISLSDRDVKKSGGSGSGNLNGFIPVYFTFNGDASTIPGSLAEVFLIAGERQNVMSVPRSALVEMQGNKYLYVVEDGHAYEKRLVKTGATDGSRVEILEGVTPGETIVSKGASIVRMAETSSIAPPSHSHNH